MASESRMVLVQRALGHSPVAILGRARLEGCFPDGERFVAIAEPLLNDHDSRVSHHLARRLPLSATGEPDDADVEQRVDAAGSGGGGAARRPAARTGAEFEHALIVLT